MTTPRRGVVNICFGYLPSISSPLSCRTTQTSSWGHLLLYTVLEGLSTKVPHSLPSKMWARPTLCSFPGLQALKKNDKKRGNICRQFINFFSFYHSWSSKYSWFPELSESSHSFFEYLESCNVLSMKSHFIQTHQNHFCCL